MTIFRCVDFETTGIPTETERHRLVEVGWTDVPRMSDSLPDVMALDPVSELVNPGIPIPPNSSAEHHITDAMVKDARGPDAVCMRLAEKTVDYYVAHKADFEREFWGGGDTPWICTWKVALRVYQDAPSHKLQALRYWLRFDDDPDFDVAAAMPAHRAGPDTYVDAFLLKSLMTKATVEQMVKWSSGPALLITCYMPKHKNKPWAQVGQEDPSYLTWILDKSDITDRDLRATARYYLNLNKQKTLV